jgi:hypothetical protein
MPAENTIGPFMNVLSEKRHTKIKKGVTVRMKKENVLSPLKLLGAVLSRM